MYVVCVCVSICVYYIYEYVVIVLYGTRGRFVCPVAAFWDSGRCAVGLHRCRHGIRGVVVNMSLVRSSIRIVYLLC